MKKIQLLIAGLLSIAVVLVLFSQAKNTHTAKPTRAPTPTNIASPSATPRPYKVANRQAYSIALFGDSMIDTMGEKTEILQNSLQRVYGPGITFRLYNYGIGAQTVTQGVERFHSPFTNKTRTYPAISELHPDVIIVGSFAYNPYSPHDPARHKETLSQLVSLAKASSKNVYVLAEIAPLGSGFGNGKNGVNWPNDYAIEHARQIVEQLHNAIAVAKEQNVTLIDAYDASRIDDMFGRPSYINPDDGIHPSFAGHRFMANLIVATVILP